MSCIIIIFIVVMCIVAYAIIGGMVAPLIMLMSGEDLKYSDRASDCAMYLLWPMFLVFELMALISRMTRAIVIILVRKVRKER